MSTLSAKQRLVHTFSLMWDVYSKPCPSNISEMLILIFLCCFVSLSISALLFVWMAFSLAYNYFVAVIVAGVCVCILPLLLIMVHPVRCVFTVIVPSIGTTQGRKILLSMALLYTLSTCIPNMIYNASHSLSMLQCSAGAMTRDVVQSSQVPFSALKDLNSYLSAMSFFYKSNYDMKMENKVEIDEMNRSLYIAFESVRAEVSMLHSKISQACQILKKMTAALFVLLMIGSAMAYVNGYLSHIQHDNVYQSRLLMDALLRVSGDDSLPKSYCKKIVKTSGVRMNAHELQRGLWGALGLLVYAAVCGLILGLEHFVYWTLQTLLKWNSDIPEINATVHIYLTIKATYLGIITQSTDVLVKSYPYRIQLLPSQCVHPLRAPERSNLISVGSFLAVAFFTLVVEVFAHRLRRKVCASFYRRREEQRTEYLLHKILRKRETSEE